MTSILQIVSVNLLEQANASAFLTQIDHYALAVLGDDLQ
jgi:hypothetical protein